MPDRSQPDPQLFWSWVGGALRPVAGWLLAMGGVFALVLGWFGTSGEALVAKQVPYLISGGLTGIALLFLGGALIGTQDVKRYGERLDRLEGLVTDLHRVLLEPDGGAEGAPAGTDPAVEEQHPNGVARVLVTPNGTTYHAPGCSVVASRGDAQHVTAAEAADRDLHPCKVCSPLALPATESRA